MSAALDRQIRPIYDALETNSNKSAVLACNKVLKKHPNNVLVKALKALALVKLQKVEESLVLCDEVLVSKPIDDSTLTAMSHVLRGLGRHSDMIAMYENAYKQQPNSEDLGNQTFFANVRVGNWKAAQQIATRLHKQFQEERYLYWSVYGALLQANDPSTPEVLRPVLLKLAQRLISSASTPSYASADRLYVHLTVLRELGLLDEAYALLDNAVGQAICEASLTVDEIRRDLVKRKGLVKEEGERALKRILEKKDRNWLEFLFVVDAVFWDITSSIEPSDDVKAACKESISKTKDSFTQVAGLDGLKDRSGLLAQLELEKRAKQHGLTSDATSLRTQSEAYFTKFSDKACCYEDLQPYTAFEDVELTQWTSFLQSQLSYETPKTLQRAINAHKLLRYSLLLSELSPEQETSRAANYVSVYIDALKFGEQLPDTELQPADDLVILAGQTYVSLWKSTGDETHLQSAAAILEYASTKSKQSYRIRMLLIRVYHLLGAPAVALEHYRLLNLKQVQSDTLSHLVLSRAATFSNSTLGDLTYLSECMESSQIYMTNSQETAEFIARAFQLEKYSQVDDFILFEDRLDNSLQRDLMKIEHVRMRLAHEQINADLVDMELIELKFIFDRLHHDNRDFDIIPNYQPRCQPSFNEQTLPFHKSPGLGWLTIFLKIYIKVFQHASDLVESVEEKLLIGDRPKPSNDPENKLPLNERLAKRKQEEVDELTPDELSFFNFATAVSEWLEPYHDHSRPPPSALLAEAAKQNELKPGHPLKNLVPENGSPTNGNSKKDEEMPPIKAAPETAVKFFDDMKARFRTILGGAKLSTDLLHVATITQEAYILFAIETARFKQASVVKIYKLGQVVQSFKDIRTKASDVLKEMSVELIKLGEESGTRERREAFIAASKTIQTSSGFDHDFVLGVAKKATDSKKQVLEGVGKGIAKVLKAH